MEKNLWNPNPGTPSQDVSQYDQSLDSNFQEPQIQDNLQAPQEPVRLVGQPEEQQLDTSVESDLWSYTLDARQQTQLPELPEAGAPGIDYDMGHLEKIGRSLMVGMGDMFDSMGDLADFIGGTPSSQVSKQVFGVDTAKPISDTFHDFADYLQSYGDTVPGLQDLENVTWDDLTDIHFWETGVARMLPFALSLLIPGTAAAKGVSMLTKGAKFSKAAKAVAAGGRSVGLSSRYANTLNATKLIKTGMSVTAAGATTNMIEGAALAGQAMNEAITQGVDINDAKHVGRQVFVDNLASMGADVIQYGLFAGQLKVAGTLGKSVQSATGALAGTRAGQAVSATLGKAAQTKVIKNLKAPSIKPLIKNSFKAIGMGAAQGVTDGVVEQFQEVYQDWSVQRRIAEAKGEDFPSYLEFFTADEQIPTRVLSFATSLLMSGVSNTIRTSTENKAKIASAIKNRAESHEVLDIFNKDLDEGTYRFRDKDGNLKELNAEQATLLAKDTAARTLIMNAVTQGESEVIMEYFAAQQEAGTITEEQFNAYTDVLTQVQEAVQAYPAQNLNNKEKTSLVSTAWLNSTVANSLSQKREEFAARAEELQMLVEDGKMSQEFADKEIAGLEKAAELALKEEIDILDATGENIKFVYEAANSRIEKERFLKEEGVELTKLAEKDFSGQELTEEDKKLISSNVKNKEFFDDAKNKLTTEQAEKAAQDLVGKEFKSYEEGKLQSDGSVEFIRQNKDGSVDAITIKDGVATKETTRADETVKKAAEEIEVEKQSEYQTFIDTGKVSDKTVENIAYKISQGQPLTKEEEAMRVGAKDKVEAILERQKKLEEKETAPTKTRRGRVTEKTTLKEKTKEAFANLKTSAEVAIKLIKQYKNKAFTKENVGKIIDAAERIAVKRRVKNAFPITPGSENAMVSLMAEKAADGLISINGIVSLAKRGTNFAGYAAGLSAFINFDADNADEAFFHENFHIFRKLYGNRPEVQEMMDHIVNQPIYKQTKLNYQENILYSVPTGKEGEVVVLRQEDALRIIQRQRLEEGDNYIVATTVQDYIYLNKIRQSSSETIKEFYEESLSLLEEEGYIELPAEQQTNIQDESLTKLAGLYGAYNQDMFISDKKKREAFNNSLKSWKEKISSSFTKEESDWSLEKASKGLYKKEGFDLEAKFAAIKTIIEENEAEYGELAKESPSTVRIQELKQEEIISKIEQEVNNTRDEVIAQAKKFYEEEMPEVLSKEELRNAEPKKVLDAIKVAVATSSMYRKAKINLAKSILSKYTIGTKEYNEVEAMLVSSDKRISNYVKEMFMASVSNETAKSLDIQAQEEVAELEMDFDAIENQEDPLVAIINGENKDFGKKFYMIVSDFINSERYAGDRGREYKQRLSKGHLMYLLKQMQIRTKTDEAFIETVSKIQDKSIVKRPTSAININTAILQDFFNYLQSEVDMSGGNIYQNVLLQFRSMTTDKAFTFRNGVASPALSIKLRRQIANALIEEKGFYLEDAGKNLESDKKESLKFIAKYENAIYREKLGYSKDSNYTESQLKVWSDTKKRLNYSRALANLISKKELTDADVRKFVNDYLLSASNNQLSENQFTDLIVEDSGLGNVTINKYFTKERLTDMLLDSLRARFSGVTKENFTLTQIQDKMKKEVFDVIFDTSNFYQEKAQVLGLVEVNINESTKKDLLKKFQENIEGAYKTDTFLNGSIEVIGNNAKLNDMIGVNEVIRKLITSKLSMEDDSYLYSITSPEGNTINKNTRKYFLEYNKEALKDYAESNPLGYQSLFTSSGITNPYASSILNNTFELFSLEGDTFVNADKDRLTNLDVTANDLNNILSAIESGSTKYKQVIKDYSDKSRRYYADANTILTKKEAKKQLRQLQKYHKGKLQSLVERHNSNEDNFDAFLVINKETLAYLEKEFGKLKTTKNKANIGKGQVNITTDVLFKLTINGVGYNLLNDKDIAKSERDLMSLYEDEDRFPFKPTDYTTAIYNYIINKYYLQDMFGNVMQEQDFTMKNKRATGFIAPHDSSYSGGRVELVMFEDEELSSAQLVHNVQVMDTASDGTVTLRNINLSGNPAAMDSASYITEEHANELISNHGNIVDVKGSFKIVGFGNNIDNKTISGMFGMENNNFYAKGHTIVLNDKVEGPLKNVYKALRAREKFYKSQGLSKHNVIAYADSGIKKGAVKGVDGTPQNKLSLSEWAKLANSPSKINAFIDSYSRDNNNNLYGYDGRFFGIQGELDKNATSATKSKQMVSGINLFRGHSNSIVRGRATQIINAVARAMTLQYEQEIKKLSREDVVLKDLNSDSLPVYEKALLEDGNLDMPAVRERTLKLLRSKVIKNTFKLRTKGTVAIQESDVLYGYKLKAGKVVQTEDSLKAMSVVKDKDGYSVTPAEAIVSQHTASQLGITQKDLDDGKVVEFIATRIPSSSAGSTVVLKVKGISTKPGNTIAVHPSVSAIIGSDLDGDMLHLNYIKEGENLSKLDEAKNSIVRNIIALYKMPEVQNSLTQEIEIDTLIKSHNKELFDSEEGDKDIPNDLHPLGANAMYGQTKGNAPMIGIIASQNLVYNYVGEGNPSLIYNNNPISILFEGKTYSNIDNSIKENGAGTWYEVSKWLNLVLDDGKNNVRQKFLFTKQTSNIFVMLIKMGIPPAKVSSFIKNANFLDALYASNVDLQNAYKEAVNARRNANAADVIRNIYQKENGIQFNVDNATREDYMAMFIALSSVSSDIFDLSHFISLDKSFEADPLNGLVAHQKAMQALERQTDIASKLGENALYQRNQKINLEIINRFFEDDTHYSNGYKEGLLGKVDDTKVLNNDGILAAEQNTQYRKDKKGKVIIRDGKKVVQKVHSTSMFTKHENLEGLSTAEDVNTNMAKAMNVMRLAVHSNMDVGRFVFDVYRNPKYGLKEQFSTEQFLSFTTEQQYGLITEAVNAYLHDNQIVSVGDKQRVNNFIGVIDSVVNHEFVIVNGTPQRIRVVRFKPNMEILGNELDFTEQVRLIQSDFDLLDKEIKNFFVAYDFLTTGWGSNGNSMSPFFNQDKITQINNTSKRAKEKGNFENDIARFKSNNRLYNPVLLSNKKEDSIVDARRIAAMSYLAIFGDDNKLDKNGLFKIETNSIGSSVINKVTTIQDQHWKSDRFKLSEEETQLTIKPLVVYSGLKETAMLTVFGEAMRKAPPKASSSMEFETGDKQYLKVPVYEYPGTDYQGVGETMSPEKYYKKMLPEDVKFEDVDPITKGELEVQYEAYVKSVKKVKELYEELQQTNIEDSNYAYDPDKQNEFKQKFLEAQTWFREYNDRLNYERVIIDEDSDTIVLPTEAGKDYGNIDELAANPLRRYLEYYFGNHIANKQMYDWGVENGKDFLDTITEERKGKDISQLDMWLSPGDFGRGKPAIAYINKNMKLTHMAYTRNINLVTKEMNEKLQALYKANYGDSFKAKAAKLWLNYMPMGTRGISEKLFGNLLDETKGLQKSIDKEDNISYRDVSDMKIKKGLVYQSGDFAGRINKKSPQYKALNQAEKDYLEMYVKYTAFYSGLIKAKGLYGKTRGSSYVPSVTSSRWETLHKRGLFGVYYQMFRGDHDLADVMIEDVNPLTGDIETLDYFSWKSIYMYGKDEDITEKSFKAVVNKKTGEVVQVPVTRTFRKRTKSDSERIKGLMRIKEKAKQHIKEGKDAVGNNVAIGSKINDMMAAESEESQNRFNAKRSMTSAYLGTNNMHRALREYVSKFMFQHGNTYFDEALGVYQHLSWAGDDRAFEIVTASRVEVENERLAFSGFEDKKQEVDAAIANLGGGKVFEPNVQYGAGRNKNAINYLQKVVKRGLISKERNFTFSDFESESKVTNFFVNWTMYVALGLNVPAAIGNVAIGKFNAYRQMGGTNTLLGEKRYWGVSETKGYDHAQMKKARKMIEEFGILTYRADEIAEGVGGSSLSSLIFYPMIAAENWIQQAAFLGALTDEQWNSYYLDKNGDLKKKEGAVGISQMELAKLERDVINVQGRGYSETDSRMIQLYALSNMTMQFKRWFPTFLKDRFGKEEIDDLGTIRMGAYTAAADFFTKLKDEGKQFDIRSWNEELKKLPKHKQEAVMRYWRGTHGVMLVAMLLGMSAMFTDEDEKDKEAVLFMEKLLGDMLLIVNAPKLTYMANVPALNTFKNLNLSIYHAVKGTEYQRESKYGKKGDKKYVSNLAQLLPSPARIPLQQKKKEKRSLR